MMRGGSLERLRAGASKGTCTLLSPLPTACVAGYALEAQNGQSGRSRSGVVAVRKHLPKQAPHFSATLW